MLKQQITNDMKAAMKGGDKPRLGVIRLILAAIKQVEVDERRELSDSDVLAVLNRMVKQRRDSLQQYQQAGRDELADQEAFELDILATYLPEQLGDDEITALIDEAIATSGAGSMKEMGKVMGILKPKLEGRADMGKVSAQIKQKLAG
ncbi:MAG TPA: GatB/YqeY domain-containing protein [Chromatiaceae bacterium]|nr:GatB/YqeY domain-containing protein [Chromatiaceae bacterium]